MRRFLWKWIGMAGFVFGTKGRLQKAHDLIFRGPHQIYANYQRIYSSYKQLNEMFQKQGETMFRLVEGLSDAVERELCFERAEMECMEMPLKSPYDWVQGFVEKYGRSPRVVHIGNVANNAYSNAKLFRRVGIEADVMCNDYYHIMGCPEWEDADFEAEFNNQFFPDWSRVDLKGFERPRWFAQGPLFPSIYYLISRSRRRLLAASLWWCEMSHQRKQLVENGGLSNCIGPVLPGFLKDDGYDFDRQVQKLVRNFNERFGAWPGGQLVAKDLEPWRWAMPYWRHLLIQYDAAQAYGTEPIVAMLADVPYFAVEHGTLREIPYLNSNIGRATALAYALAEHVFVTNADCVAHARRLAGERVTFINHPYDEDLGLSVKGEEALKTELCAKLDADFLFFFPTRHDWVGGGNFGNKANDVFLRAFCQLRKEGLRVGMVCCLWGNNIAESMELLTDRNCTDFVRWVPPQGMIAFIRYVKACHIVVDQFGIGAFGGVFFKSLAVGGVICSYLNKKDIIDRYGECPPLLNCKTENEIVSAIKSVIQNPECLGSLSREARKWVKRHHAGDDTVAQQMKIYREAMK